MIDEERLIEELIKENSNITIREYLEILQEIKRIT